MHQAMAATLDRCVELIRGAQAEARRTGVAERPRWPMIVLRAPKGWTAPAELDGHALEGSWRAHQVPIPAREGRPRPPARARGWLRSYRPEELFDAAGAPVAAIRELAPRGSRRMGASPHANGGLLKRALRLPDFRPTRSRCRPRASAAEHASARRSSCATSCARTRSFRLFSPDENTSNRLDAVYAASPKLWLGERLPQDADGGAARAGRPRRRDAVRAHAGGDAGGLPAHRPSRPPLVVRGVRPHHRLDVQPAREVARDLQPDLLAAGDRLAQPARHLHGVAAGPQRLHPPGPGLPRRRREQELGGDADLPAAGRELPAVGRGPLPPQRELRERDRRRQAASPAVPPDGRRDRPLREGPRHLGLGEQRRGRTSPTW